MGALLHDDICWRILSLPHSLYKLIENRCTNSLEHKRALKLFHDVAENLRIRTAVLCIVPAAEVKCHADFCLARMGRVQIALASSIRNLHKLIVRVRYNACIAVGRQQLLLNLRFD